MEKRSFIRLIKNELFSLPQNSILVFNFCCLIALVFLIGSIYDMGTLKQIPTVIADLDQTSGSRNILNQFADSEKFIVTTVDDYPSLLETVKEGRATVGIVVPPGISRAIKRQSGAEVLLIINSTNYITAYTAYAKAHEILQTINGGIALKTLEGKGFLPWEAEKTVQSVKLDQKVLYNPDYNYSYYLSYGVFSAGIFSLLMTSIAITLSRQRVKKDITGLELAAKLIVYGMCACIITNLVFWIAQIIFKLPARGTAGNFFGLTIVFGYLIAIFALLLLIVSVNEVRIFQAGVFFATPLFFVTGYTWPYQSIPCFLKPLYYICPLTPFLNGARACLVMGAGSSVILKYIVWQLVLIVGYLPLAALLYRIRFSGKSVYNLKTDY